MANESSYDSEWKGLRGRIMGRYLNSPLRRLSEVLFLGDARSRVIAEVVAGLTDRGPVLDVGAGSGYFSLAIAAKLPQARLICLDLSTEMLQHLRQAARKKGFEDRIELLLGSVYQIRLGDASVDLAMANGVFHELTQPKLALQEMVRLVCPGGRVIVSDFGDNWIGRRIASAHRSADHGPFGKEELRMLFAEVGLRDTKVSVVRNLLVAVGTK